jgi:acyl carrier protein
MMDCHGPHDPLAYRFPFAAKTSKSRPGDLLASRLLPLRLWESTCCRNLRWIVRFIDGERVMAAYEAICRKVTAVLVQALNADQGDVVSTATLQGDLGAESIDFLDIVFRLEREFAIKIPRGELFPESVFRNDPDYVKDGRVTDQGMRELRSLMPYASLSALDQDRRLSAVADLFTVDLVARYIEWKLGQGVEARAMSGVVASGSTSAYNR